MIASAGADASPERDERTLVEQARAGDQVALGQLFDAHYERVFRYIRFKVGNEQDAEDIAQETFLRMYTALERFEHRGIPFRAWLMQITVNLVSDFYRKRGSSPRTWSLQDGEFDLPGGDDPAEMLLLQARLEDTMAAMAHLTEAEREVIHLRYAAQLNIAETAAVAGKSENNIKQLTFKALHKLRKVLSQQDAGNP